MLMIEVYSPSADRSYDFQMTEDIKAGDAARSFAEMIARKNGCTLADDAAASLYDVSGKRKLDDKVSLEDNGILSGMKLILV